MKREVAQNLIDTQILDSSEVAEKLLINRSRLKALIDAGKITPLKVLKNYSLFWLPDVEILKAELMKDSRSNLFKKVRIAK